MTSEIQCPAEGDDIELDWLDLPGAVAAWNRIRRAARALGGPNGSIAETLNAAAALADLASKHQPKGTPKLVEWDYLCKHGQWRDGVPTWARDHSGQMNDGTAKNAVIEELRAALAANQAPAPGADALRSAVIALRDKARASFESSASPGYKLHDLYRIELDAILASTPAAQAPAVGAERKPFAWVRRNVGFNSGAAHFGEHAPPGWATAIACYAAPPSGEQQAAQREKQRSVSALLDRADEAHKRQDYGEEQRLRDAASLVHGI